ncbi:MAG TPA: hypothetical protein VF116_14800 [Ktedonobacterales bacterium]
MTADTTCDREATLTERRAAFEMAVVNALLEESAAEREERLELVRIARGMTLRTLDLLDTLDTLDDEPRDN